jgi:GNAT superfamily N-acetyltransferase
LRDATNRDASAVIELIRRVLDEFGLTLDLTHADRDLLDIEASYLSKGGWFKVLEFSDPGIIGCVGLVPMAPATIELKRMYLAPEHRGVGIGRMLLEAALFHARYLQCDSVALETSSRFTRALSLYRSTGFRARVGRSHSPDSDVMLVKIL